MLALYDPLWDKLVSAAEPTARLDLAAPSRRTIHRCKCDTQGPTQEPMLELADPLWDKLDDAQRDRDIPILLAELAASWDGEAAKSLLWDCLCHQQECYGATYAAIPYLLKIAEPEENRCQRREIALFLGFVALRARDFHHQVRGRQFEGAALQGLPETLEGWDRIRDCFRGHVAWLERPDRPHHYEQTLPRYRRVVAIEPVNADDLEKILSIKAEFFSALPCIRALCERSLLEDVADKEAVFYLLSGIAAADGLLSIARLLNYGDEGLLQCTSCSQEYEFIRFGERIAIYATDPTPSAVRHADDKGLSDYEEGTPSRADGFVVPIAETTFLTPALRHCFRLRSVRRARSLPCCCAISSGASFAANAA